MSEEKQATDEKTEPPKPADLGNQLAGYCSENIEKIAEALSKAQGEINNVKKDETADVVMKDNKGKFQYSYATLASCWEACRKPLSDNGLAVVQTLVPNPNIVRVVTILTHTSGQWFKSIIELKPTKPDAQGFGSAMTYARRYGLSAMVGLSPDDDDDGAAAVQKQPQQQRKQPPKRMPTDLVNPGELKQLFSAAGSKNIEPGLMKVFFELQYGYSTSKQLTVGQWGDVMKTLRHKDTDDNTIHLIVDGLQAEKKMSAAKGETEATPEVPF